MFAFKCEKNRRKIKQLIPTDFHIITDPKVVCGINVCKRMPNITICLLNV